MAGLTKRDKTVLGGTGALLLVALFTGAIGELFADDSSGTGTTPVRPAITRTVTTPPTTRPTTEATSEETEDDELLDSDGDGVLDSQEIDPGSEPESDEQDEPESAYYANCAEARAAGAAPLYRGDPGYRAGLDRDKDGDACE